MGAWPGTSRKLTRRGAAVPEAVYASKSGAVALAPDHAYTVLVYQSTADERGQLQLRRE